MTEILLGVYYLGITRILLCCLAQPLNVEPGIDACPESVVLDLVLLVIDFYMNTGEMQFGSFAASCAGCRALMASAFSGRHSGCS